MSFTRLPHYLPFIPVSQLKMDHGYQHNQTASSAKFECLLFDLDDTLYPLSSGLSKACTKNIEEYMVQKLGIEESKVSEINQVLYKNYGTSMAGLKAIGYNFDNDDYHSFVHGRLPYENLKPDLVLRNILLSSPLRKIVFSNGDKVHVAKALKKLGLEDCFEMIINFETLNPAITNIISDNNNNNDEKDKDKDDFDTTTNIMPKTPIVCKPFKNAFELAFQIAKINPEKTVFFDDSVRNIQFGKGLGMHTILIGTSKKTNGADYALESIHDIKEALPELWGRAEVCPGRFDRCFYSKKISTKGCDFSVSGFLLFLRFRITNTEPKSICWFGFSILGFLFFINSLNYYA